MRGIVPTPISDEELTELRARLEEAEQTLAAIRNGEVEALLVSTAEGDRVFTLQGADHRYRRLVETMNEGAVLVSRESTILYANRALATLTGRPLDTLLGASILDLVDPASRADLESLLRATLALEDARREISLVSPDAHPIPVLVSASVNAPGEERGICLIVTDLRDQERTRKMVALADAERIARGEAEQERARAEEANRAKDEFLATVSHELRTPLNAMLGWSRLLREGHLDDGRRVAALEIIERNAVAQAQLVEDILDVSRITTGNLRLDVQLVHPAEVIEAVLSALRLAMEARGLRDQVILDRSAGPIRADPHRLQQIVWNLLSNAVKFTPRGGHVQVVLSQVDSHIEIEVSDSGPGVPADVLPRLFERFFQADGSSTRRHGGLGLGLAIVRHLVELHGGSIHAENGREGGARFLVRLPRAAVGTGAVPTPREHPAAPIPLTFERPLELRGLHVLVVDDEEDAVELLAAVLEGCGARVTRGNSVAAAMEAFQLERPDVVLSDIGMPGEDGYSFVRKLRRLAPADGGQTPAAALTAYASAEDRRRALLAGFQMHVAKPVEPAELVAVVASLARIAGALRG